MDSSNTTRSNETIDAFLTGSSLLYADPEAESYSESYRTGLSLICAYLQLRKE
jgi:hypothetical protein